MLAISNPSPLTTLALLVSLSAASVGCGDSGGSGGGSGVGGGTSQTVTGPVGSGGGGGSDPCAGVDCSDMDPCTDDACVDGACPHGLDATPDFGLLDVVGDCQVIVCTGTPPAPTTMDDDLDVPSSDGNACTLDTCAAGVPHPDVAQGITCNTTGVCDGLGNCSACNLPIDCGMDTACGTRTCNGNTCGWNYEIAGTVVGADLGAGNCKNMICDGLVETSAQGPDDTDAPQDLDPDDCMVPSCSGGVPSMANAADDSPCDDGGSEAYGQCLSGGCEDCTASLGCDSGHACVANLCCTMTMAMVCGAAECGTVVSACAGLVNCGSCLTSGKGDDCSAAKLCQCDDSNDCLQPGANGTECLGDMSYPDVCGCYASSDCADSKAGKYCFQGTYQCGCTEANESSHCAGIGPETCDGTTGTCNP